MKARPNNEKIIPTFFASALLAGSIIDAATAAERDSSAYDLRDSYDWSYPNYSYAGYA
jgi:hypothetical protein